MKPYSDRLHRSWKICICPIRKWCMRSLTGTWWSCRRISCMRYMATKWNMSPRGIVWEIRNRPDHAPCFLFVFRWLVPGMYEEEPGGTITIKDLKQPMHSLFYCECRLCGAMERGTFQEILAQSFQCVSSVVQKYDPKERYVVILSDERKIRFFPGIPWK